MLIIDVHECIKYCQILKYLGSVIYEMCFYKGDIRQWIRKLKQQQQGFCKIFYATGKNHKKSVLTYCIIFERTLYQI